MYHVSKPERRVDSSRPMNPPGPVSGDTLNAFFIVRYVLRLGVTILSGRSGGAIWPCNSVCSTILNRFRFDLEQIYADRLVQIERLDQAGFYAYHLAEHHTPAVHSLAPSQNVFLAAVSQRTQRLRFGPCVYVLPLHHPVRLIEEISMLDNLSGGRMEIGVGRGGVLEAFFWGQDSDVEMNYARYLETLAIMREGLSHDELTYHGQFYDFDQLPMRMRPKQAPYPPLWYMRNIQTAAAYGMNAVLDVPLSVFDAYVKRYRELWEEHQGVGALTHQGTEPRIGLIAHMLLAETDEQAVAEATPAWKAYRWNLESPRRLEAEKRGLTQFLGDRMRARPAIRTVPGSAERLVCLGGAI